MIRAENVVKYFGDFKALRGATLHVTPGAIYGLVGPNGAGKSTLIRHLTGIYQPDAGCIMIDGESVFENPKIKSRIAYIPDDFYFFLQSSVMDMKKFYKGLYKSFDEELFGKLTPFFPKIDSHQTIRTLSKGMQKQVAFWLAISCHPDVMILDEPVDGLDPVMRKQIWGILMKEVSDRGVTVLVSSHNLRELEDVCDHVGIMSEGRIMLERSLSDLQDNTVKVQTVLQAEDSNLLKLPGILHHTQAGRVHTLIIKGHPEEIQQQINSFHPMFVDLLPLTLEEIFIYELGGENYGIKDILL